MVELALVATVFLMLIFGIMDFGRALYTYHAVANAAREGSRWAIVRGNTCPIAGCPAHSADVQTYVRGRNGTLMDPTQLAVTATYGGNTGCAAGNEDRGCLVTVTVTYPFHFAELPFADLTMTSTSKMYITQ
jgi:Flp pilus assembly protein TadG